MKNSTLPACSYPNVRWKNIIINQFKKSGVNYEILTSNADDNLEISTNGSFVPKVTHSFGLCTESYNHRHGDKIMISYGIFMGNTYDDQGAHSLDEIKIEI